jgi:hypothetical protein
MQDSVSIGKAFASLHAAIAKGGRKKNEKMLHEKIRPHTSYLNSPHDFSKEKEKK